MSTATLITFDEFEQLPDEGGKRELIDGEIIELPPADLLHSLLGDHLLVMLKAAFASQPFRVMGEVGIKISERHYLQPDIAVIALADLDAARGQKYLNVVPAISIEILSEGNRATAVDRKVRLYLELGCQEVWTIHPQSRRIWIYSPDGTARVYESKLESSLLPEPLDVQAVFHNL